MITYDTTEGDWMIIVDNRPMYRSGIKSMLQSMRPGCRFSEYHLMPELTTDSPQNGSSYFFIRIGKMPDRAIISDIKRLRSAYKSCKIILYDYQQSVDNLINFFREKIDAYLPDDFSGEDLHECISSLTENRVYVNMQIAIELLIKNPIVRPRKTSKLTPTEIKVANFLVNGLSPSLIAKEMDRKISTISTIKSNIFKKTQVNNVVDLMGAMECNPRTYVS